MFYNNTEISTHLHTGAVYCIFGRKVELVLPEAVKSCPVYMRKSGYVLPGDGGGGGGEQHSSVYLVPCTYVTCYTHVATCHVSS